VDPARSISPAAIAGIGTDLLIFIVGPLVGGHRRGLAYGYERRAS
jgi:hypothetical protein